MLTCSECLLLPRPLAGEGWATVPPDPVRSGRPGQETPSADPPPSSSDLAILADTPPLAVPDCCSAIRTGLVLPDGRQRCRAHATAEDVTLVEAVDDRARCLGLRRTRNPCCCWGQHWAWPYGPNINVSMRLALLDWAEPQDLRRARSRGCPHWPRNGRCCSAWSACVGGYWTDHVTTWTQADGEPAVFLAQPYVLMDDDIAALRALDADPGLSVEVKAEGGWYGFGTWAVEVWRASSWQGSGL